VQFYRAPQSVDSLVKRKLNSAFCSVVCGDLASDKSLAFFGCAVEMERASHKISHVLQTLKDSLMVLKEAEEMIEGEGSTNEVLFQASRIMRDSVGKLIADVGPCVERKRRALLEVDPKGKRKAVSYHVRADVNAKRRAVLNCGIVYGHGEHLEVMDPLLWGNLPVPLLELVFDRVTYKIRDSTQCRSIRLTDLQQPNKVNVFQFHLCD